MSETAKNKVAAQIIKAEMMGDQDKVRRLKHELDDLNGGANMIKLPDVTPQLKKPTSHDAYHLNRDWKKPEQSNKRPNRTVSGHDVRIQRFLSSTSSIGQMFDQEKKLSASDEAMMYLKTSAKFSRDCMETKFFSTEIDDSQKILNRSKRHKQGEPSTSTRSRSPDVDEKPCSRCKETITRHLVVHNKKHVFLALPTGKPFLSLSNVYISNLNHRESSFVSSDMSTQIECEDYIRILKEMWLTKGYQCIIMETYFRDRHPSKSEFVSCGNHFQVHCLPIKKKHYEQARMSFKVALQECEQEWSMNTKLLVTDGRRIQRYLPKGLSYFWVCFDELTNGFAHVIENEKEFSRFFGLEVLSGMLNKDFNSIRLDSSDTYSEAFNRSREFKLMFMEHYGNQQKDASKES